MAKDYTAYRNALKEQYDEKEEESRVELENVEQEGERKIAQLVEEREEGAREAYVREQRELNDLSEKTADSGERGGRELVGKWKIHSAYEQEMEHLRDAYEEETEEISAKVEAKRASTDARMEKDRAEYLAKLSKLAAEEKAAAEAAAKVAAQKSAQKKPEKNSTGKQESEEKENGLREEIPIRVVKAGNKALVFVNGARVANETVWDGSGRVMISVSGQKMTPEEAEQGVLNGTVQRYELENGRSFYQIARGYGAGGGDRVANDQEYKDATKILSGILSSPGAKQMIWEESKNA